MKMHHRPEYWPLEELFHLACFCFGRHETRDGVFLPRFQLYYPEVVEAIEFLRIQIRRSLFLEDPC
jgi:hypothetical protein